MRKFILTMMLVLFGTPALADYTMIVPQKPGAGTSQWAQIVAKELEKKGKTMKANQKYEKAQKLLIQSNKKYPNKADTLNYLGFTTRKLGDFENGEKYYLQGLKINPKHIGINEYLGELYVATNRHNLAVERLEVLKGCNCKEYDDLKAIIAGKKVSKY